MPVKTAKAIWEDNLKNGEGKVELESGLLKVPYSFSSRLKLGDGTNPEELIAGAQAGCFSMALSMLLTRNGYTPDKIETEASIQIEDKNGGYEITEIQLETECKVPDIDENKFKQLAIEAKNNCPVSKALQGPIITLESKLIK